MVQNTDQVTLSPSPLDRYFDQIYIINLAHRTDRWQAMRYKMQKLHISNYLKFPAINGKQEPFVSYWRKLPSFYESAGAYGLLHTIYQLLLHAHQNQHRKILILEDDVIFHRDFNQRFTQAVTKLPSWKLLYLGSSLHDWRFKERCHFRTHYLTAKGSIPGAFALGVDASVFLALAWEVKKCQGPWDLLPLKVINTRFPGQCPVLFPNLVIADPTDSDIRNDKSLWAKAKKCRWNLSQYDFSNSLKN